MLYNIILYDLIYFMSIEVSSPGSIFLDACKAQEVTMSMDVARGSGILYTIAFEHQDILRGVRYPALDAPLNIDAMPDVGPVRMLAALANVASGYSEGVDSQFEVTAPATLKGHHGDCPNAEKHWNRTLESFAGRNPPLAEVYVDDNGTAVAMRKGRGAVPTALLLQSVRIIDDENDPFTYLPGSLVHLSAIGDEERIKRFSSSRKLQVPENGIVRPWSEVTGMTYLRETPLAYNERGQVECEPYAQNVSVQRPWETAQAFANLIIQQAQPR
jgi:hypothetical protein